VTSKPHDYIIAAEADLDVAIGLLYAVVVRASTLSCSQHIDQYFAAAAVALLRSTRGSAACLWLFIDVADSHHGHRIVWATFTFFNISQAYRMVIGGSITLVCVSLIQGAQSR